MNFLNTTLLQSRARFSRTLLFGLLAACAVEARAVSLPQRIFSRSGEPRSTVVATSEAVGYLASVGPVPLRFAPPPPDPVERPAPVAATPPVSPVAVAEPTVQPVVHATPSPAEQPAGPAEPAMPGVQPEKPVTILPDDTPRDVRAEDFLPYFELPRSADGRSGAPAPFTPAGAPVQPPSSATYQQK